MWQDITVTLVAAAAVGVLGRRWLRTRSTPTGSCPSCASGATCTVAQKPDESPKAVPLRLVRKEEMGRERFGPGGDYRF